MHSLPLWERGLSALVWIIHSLASIWLVRCASRDNANQLPLVSGSFGDDYLYDASDIEWYYYKQSLRLVIGLFAVHSLLFNCLPLILSAKWTNQIMMFVWLAMRIYLTGAISTVLLAVLAIFCAILTRRLQTLLPVWLIAICFVVKATDVAPFSTNPHVYYRQFNAYLYASLQIINFCSYLIKSKNDSLKSINIWYNYAQYILYPPYSVTLIVLYEDFNVQLANRMQNSHKSTLVFRLIRLLLWYFLLEISLHFLYIPALFSSLHSINIVKQLDLYSLASLAYLAGQFFHVKYVLIFGIPAWFAIVDGMTPPHGPICISRVTKYSQMWRYFDRGLYEFLKHRLYLPLIGNQFSIFRRLLAMFVVFGFVLAWHGTAANYRCWVALSIIEILIERVATVVASTNIVRQHIFGRISPANNRRLLAWALLATVVPGIFGVFYFLGRYGAGQIVFDRILVTGLHDLLLDKWNIWNNGPTAGFVLLHMLFLGYFYNQVCIDLEDTLKIDNEPKNMVKSD